MKKSYLIIAVTALIFAACTKNDSLKEVIIPDTVIGFSTFAAKQTRAENSTQTSTDNLEGYNTTFKVWSYKNVYATSTTTSDDYVFGHVVGTSSTTYPGTVVRHDGTKWVYSPLRFWDKSANYYKFFAAAPARMAWEWDDANDKLSLDDFTIKGENRVTDGTGALGVLTYTSNTSDPKALLMSDLDDEDLMISTDITDWKTYNGTDVNLQFNHILSRLNIGFRKSTDLDDYIVKLNTIEIHNLIKKASFDENTTLTKQNAGVYGTYDATDDPAQTELLEKGTAARWTAASTPVRFTSNEMKYLVESNNEVVPLEIDYTETSTATKHGYQYVFQGLVIPQVIEYTKTIEAVSTETGFKMDGSDATTSSDPYIVIDYEIWTKAEDARQYTATDPEVITGAATTNDTKPAVASYKLDGYKYFYNLADVFNGNTANDDDITFCEGWQNTLLITLKPTAITFDAEVYGWADNGAVEVDIDK